MAQLFADKGYASNSFHGSEAEIYTRGAIHENLGYEKYYAGSDMQMHHYQFDRYLMSGYETMTEGDPFFSFIITISGHGAYGPHNLIGKEHQAAADAVAKRTEENYRYAVAHAMETDLFIGMLVEQLAMKHGQKYIDVNRALKDDLGRLKAEYTIEGMHIKEDGYRAIMDDLIPYATEA